MPHCRNLIIYFQISITEISLRPFFLRSPPHFLSYSYSLKSNGQICTDLVILCKLLKTISIYISTGPFGRRFSPAQRQPFDLSRVSSAGSEIRSPMAGRKRIGTEAGNNGSNQLESMWAICRTVAG